MKEKLNKKTALIGAASFLLLAGGTASVMEFFGTSSGDVNVDNAIDINGEENPALSYDRSNDVAGDYFMADLNSDNAKQYMNLSSNQDENVVVSLSNEYSNETDGSNYVNFADAQDGATTHNIVYKQPDASNYDAVVDSETDLEEAITNSTEKVVVESGTYTLSGDKDLGVNSETDVIASAEGAGQTTINLDEVTIEASSGDSLTVKGFEFTGSGNGDHGDGFIFRSTDNSGLEGTLTVADNIFDASTTASDQREYRYVWAQDVKTLNVEDNFFTGNSDAGIEVNADEGGSTDYHIKSNTFAGLVDKGVALRVEDSGTLEVKNNNFVSNSNAAIELGSGSSADFTTEGNYFNHTGDKVEENSAGASYSLDEADNPQTDSEATISPSQDVLVNQVSYLDVGISSGDYGFQTLVEPVR